jgi:poly(beta-D-mannuronate) lyase
MPAGSYTTADPKLVKNASGIFHLQKGSPAINAAKGNYPQVTVDMDGQPGTGKWDTGADQFSSDVVRARILLPGDVGAGGK